MKKLLYSALTIFMCITLSIPSYALGFILSVKEETSTTEQTAAETEPQAEIDTAASEEATPPQTEPETTEDMSSPRFMVTGYELDTKTLRPGKQSVLKVYIKNYSKTKALKNIVLSISDESRVAEFEGMPKKYVESVYAGSTYTWEIKLTALATAEIGKHGFTVMSEYEDSSFSSYSSSDTIYLNVTQTVALDYSGASLPEKVVEGETETMTISFMNTGKTDIRNCKIIFSVKNLESGGTVFVGEIPAGESSQGSVNYKPTLGALGETSGTVKITYEDVFGKSYEKTEKVSTLVEEKVEVAVDGEEEGKRTNTLWWLFILIGAALGGGMGYGIPVAIRNKKQRKEDELRL